jgi:multidrug resistance efflux pump
MSRNRIIIGLVASAVLIAVCALALVNTGVIAGAESAATGTPLPPVRDAGGVIADGKVVPAVGAELAFPLGGMVAEVRVEEGGKVGAGDVLARLAGCEPAEAEVAAAEQELIAARQALEEVKRNGPVLAAQAALDERAAREKKETAESNGWDASNSEVTRMKYALLVAEWRAALARLARYPDGVPAEEIRLAESRVTGAEKRRTAAEAGLRNLELRSPVSGSVVFLDLKAGQFAAPGAVVAAVADLSAWQVRTVDLNETDVIRVAVGDEAVVAFDALPGLELAGKVTAVGAYGQNRLGETVYTVTIELDQADSRLRWNMTAMVKIASA